MKKAIVCGAGGFIGGHMVKRLVSEGYEVIAVDIKPKADWDQVSQKAYSRGYVDLRDTFAVNNLISLHRPDELYQFAADMGGAGYIFTG